MIIIEYAPDGEALSDWDVAGRVSEILDRHRKSMGIAVIHEKFSTSRIFDAMRVAITDGMIFHDNVIFRFEGKDIIINEYCAIVDWPDGFCDFGCRSAEKNHSVWGHEKRRKKKTFRKTLLTTGRM